jgi:hypothetical protein
VTLQYAREYGVSTKIYTFYIGKEQIAVTKNDHVMRKSLGLISLVRALTVKVCKVDPSKLYKIES